MLDQLFMQILDMSRIASIVILFVLLARLLLRRAPKVYSYVLWAVVLFRLLCPVSIEAPVALMPEITPTAQHYTLSEESISFVGAGVAAQQAVGDVLNGGIDMQNIPTTEKDEQGNVEYVSAHWWEVWVLFGKYLWLGGIAVMAIYSLQSYCKLKKQLTEAALLRENIYLVDGIGSPFVMGVLRPKIYLPSALSVQEQGYIIRHEQYHIRRFDHVFKGLAFIALCLHWFNPLAWLAFVLAGKDMEMSCDEAVMRKMDGDIRADYSASLLALATGRRIIAGTPLAFGEGDTKSRIRNVLGWKRPKVWVTVLATVFCVLILAACITDPVQEEENEDTSTEDYGEQTIDKYFSPDALKFEMDDWGMEERIAWFETGKEDCFGEMLVTALYPVDGEYIAWVSELTGTPHKGQYRLHLRYPDGGVAKLPLPWNEYPVTAIPDAMELTEDTFVYEMTFEENSYYNNGVSVNHLQGTYRYTVYLAEKIVSLEISNHREVDGLVGVWETEIPLTVIGEVADPRTVTATARYTFSADGNVIFEILPHEEGLEGQRETYEYVTSGDFLTLKKDDSVEQQYTYRISGDTLALTGRIDLVLQRVG